MEAGVVHLPQARHEGVLWRELPDGAIVYDEERGQAHSLNQAAASVWRHCDGGTTVSQMAVLLQQELQLPADEAVVFLALDHLASARLLQGTLSHPVETASFTRRSVIRKLGLAGGLVALLPLVESVIAPAAADHASHQPKGGNQSFSADPAIKADKSKADKSKQKK